jgi:hypothetical protein
MMMVDDNTDQVIPVHKRGYQAEVHFGLGAVIQGVTVAALGAEVASAIQEFVFPETLWILGTGLLSFILCLTFWVSFINNYFFGFRVVVLNARMHVLFSAQYLLLGLLQLMAIHFLANPRLWLTFFVLLFLVAILGSLFLYRNMVVIGDENVRKAIEYDPGANIFNGLFVLSLLLLIFLYIFPAINTPIFNAAALFAALLTLVVFNLNFLKVFQKHLDVGR